MVADMVAFVASQFTTSTWDVGAQELCSVVLIYKPEIAQKAARCALVGCVRCTVPCDVPSTTIYNSRMAYMRS